MAKEELHDVVDIGKIEPVSVRINERWDTGPGSVRTGPPKTYTVTYRLPIAVSEEWQYMFQKPDPMSGVVHQVAFDFSKDGTEVNATLDNEPAPELLLVLKEYAKRANRRWEEHRKTIEDM